MVDRGVFSDIFNPLSFVDEAVRSFAVTRGPVDMGPDFAPGEGSVVCGRGKECYNHEGNRRFRLLCETHLDRYKAATSKVDKSQIVTTIVDAVRAGDGGGAGGFVARDPKTNRWVDVGDDAAREKTGQQLRDLLTRKRVSRKEAASGSSESRRAPAALSPPRSEQASRKRAAGADDEGGRRGRRRYDDDGTLDWTSADSAATTSPSTLCSTASPTTPLSPIMAACSDSAPPPGTGACDTPPCPALAPSVSLGGSHDEAPTPHDWDSSARNQRFAMPACRIDETAAAHTPFWNSPLGVAADLREFFDHGEDDDEDGGDDGRGSEDEYGEEAGDSAAAAAARRCDPRDRDPLLGLQVPQF